MTDRELEVFAAGVEDGRRVWRDLAAWLQVNLINSNIPRGKPRLRVEQILPPMKRRTMDGAELELEVVDALPLPDNATPAEKVAAMKARVRRTMAVNDARDFWQSEEGRRIKAMLGDEVAEED